VGQRDAAYVELDQGLAIAEHLQHDGNVDLSAADAEGLESSACLGQRQQTLCGPKPSDAMRDKVHTSAQQLAVAKVERLEVRTDARQGAQALIIDGLQTMFRQEVA
jgi:hypothetical protein